VARPSPILDHPIKGHTGKKKGKKKKGTSVCLHGKPSLCVRFGLAPTFPGKRKKKKKRRKEGGTETYVPLRRPLSAHLKPPCEQGKPEHRKKKKNPTFGDDGQKNAKLAERERKEKRETKSEKLPRGVVVRRGEKEEKKEKRGHGTAIQKNNNFPPTLRKKPQTTHLSDCNWEGEREKKGEKEGHRKQNCFF